MLRIIFRTVFMYLAVCVAVRLMGKRQIGDMQPTELVVTLLISEIAAIALQDTSQPVLIGLASMLVLVILEILASVLILKNTHLRRIFGGKSIVIIKNGKIDQKAMKSVRMTVFDLVEMLRMQGVFNIDEVDSAILEINGNLSVRPKAAFAPAVSREVTKNPQDGGLPMPVITDGIIMDSSLQFLGLSRQELNQFLQKRSLKAQNIYLMTLDFARTATIVLKEQDL